MQAAVELGDTAGARAALQAHPYHDVELAHAMWMAAGRGATEIIELLLQAGVDPNVHNARALRAASAAGHVECVRILLDAGADPRSASDHALRSAAEAGHATVVEALLESGADPRAKGDAPIKAAASYGHASVVSMLLRVGANPSTDHAEAHLSPLVLASANGHAAVVRVLLGSHAVDAEDIARALAYAARFARTDACIALIARVPPIKWSFADALFMRAVAGDLDATVLAALFDRRDSMAEGVREKLRYAIEESSAPALESIRQRLALIEQAKNLGDEDIQPP